MSRFKLEDFKPQKAAETGLPRSILLYGPPKKGKSTFAASIVDVPGYQRVLVLDVEGGASAISKWYPEVDVQVVNTPDMLDGLLEALVNGKIVEPDSGLPYEAVIIDTVDKAFERKLEQAEAMPEAKGNAFFKWGIAKTWTEKIRDMTHMAPFLTIFVAHVVVDKDDKTGRLLETLAIGGQSKHTFAATPDIVGYFDVVKQKVDGKSVSVRSLDLTLNERRITGQRYADALDGVIAEPTMEKIYKKIAPQLFKDDK